MDLSDVIGQAQFGELVGISQPAVSELVKRGVLTPGACAAVWLLEYCGNLREQAAGRQSEGGMNLATERARLSRAQAEIAELNLRMKRGEVVPIAGLEARLKAAIIAAREFLLGQPPRLSILLEGLDRHGREDLLTTSFNDFLHRLAALPDAHDPVHTSAQPDPEDDD